MAGFRRPGPLCNTLDGFDLGTLARYQSPIPGFVCSFRIEHIIAEASAEATHTAPSKSASNAHPIHNRTRKTAKQKKDFLAAAFDRCQKLGWVEFFKDAANGTHFEPALLMGIGYRESHLDPKYLNAAGDHGHGYGLMQIDVRSYPKWVHAGEWKDAKKCILKGTEVLAAKYKMIESSIGKKIPVRSLRGKKHHFEGKPINGEDLLRVSIAAYNCGMWAYYHYSKGHDIDQGTTGQDYSSDVLLNTQKFKVLLAQHENRGNKT